MIWVRIAGTPARQFHRPGDDVSFLAPQQARHALLKSAGTLRSAVEGETSNITVTLENGSGQCVRLFALPPLNAVADVLDNDRVLFTGTIRSIELDEECRLAVQA